MWEEEMLAEYLASRHPTRRTLQRVRLGPVTSALPDATLSETERRLIGAAWRRHADAVIVEDARLVIVECALIPDPGDVSRLLTYLELAPHTPELLRFTGRSFSGLLVWAVDDPFSRRVAERNKLQIDLFRPSNFLDFLSNAPSRKQAHPRNAPVLFSR